MAQAVEIGQPRTVGDVLGERFELGVNPQAKEQSLDELSHEDFGVLVELVSDLRGKVEAVEDTLNQEWARRFELHQDGSVVRRSTE